MVLMSARWLNLSGWSLELMMRRRGSMDWSSWSGERISATAGLLVIGSRGVKVAICSRLDWKLYMGGTDCPNTSGSVEFASVILDRICSIAAAVR
jgi:hypothetical protein